LAAILFPVFAQAKEAAKKTSCLSNVKQMALAFAMYTTDYDDTTELFKQIDYNTGKTNPAFDANGNSLGGGYWFDLLQPYAKNFSFVYCPDRHYSRKNDEKYFVPPAGDGNYYEPGYGYDDGFVSDGGFGLTYSVVSTPGNTIRPGRNQSEIVSPADMVAFGDTYDNGSMSAAMDNMWGHDGPENTATIRHGGKLNFGFVDGHAKLITMVAGNFTDTNGDGNTYFVARAASENDALKWCYDPNAPSVYASFNGGNSQGYPVNSASETCSQVVADFFNPTYFQQL